MTRVTEKKAAPRANGKSQCVCSELKTRKVALPVDEAGERRRTGFADNAEVELPPTSDAMYVNNEVKTPKTKQRAKKEEAVSYWTWLFIGTR